MELLTKQQAQEIINKMLGRVKSLDARESLPNDKELVAYLKHKGRRSNQKANKQVGKADFEWNNIGEAFYCKTNVGIVPFNTRGGTTYQIPANRVMLAVKMQGWYALYLTNGFTFDSVADLKENCKFVRVKSEEIRRIEQPVVWREQSRAAVRKMVGRDFVSVAQLPLVQAVYPL